MSRRHSTRPGTSSRRKRLKRTGNSRAKKRAAKLASALQEINARYAGVFKRLAE